MVTPKSSRILTIFSSTSSASRGESPAVGSSNSMSLGFRIMAIPMPSICRCPPLSTVDFLFWNSFSMGNASNMSGSLSLNSFLLSV